MSQVEDNDLEGKNAFIFERRRLIENLVTKKIKPSLAIRSFLDSDPDNPNPYAVEYRQKIERAGFNLEQVRQALVSEAAYVIGLRLGDIMRPRIGQWQSESSEQKVKDVVRELGFDADNAESLTEARNKLIDLM